MFITIPFGIHWDFVIGKNATAELVENEVVGTRTGSFVSKFEKSTFGENQTSLDHVIERKVADGIRK